MLNESQACATASGATSGLTGNTHGGDVAVKRWSTRSKKKARWSHGLKKELVLRLLRGEPIHAVSREMAIPIYQLERWRNRALAGIDAALTERRNDPLEASLEDANRRIDELAMEVEVLRKTRRPKRSAISRGSVIAVSSG